MFGECPLYEKTDKMLWGFFLSAHFILPNCWAVNLRQSSPILYRPDRMDVIQPHPVVMFWNLLELAFMHYSLKASLWLYFICWEIAFAT